MKKVIHLVTHNKPLLWVIIFLNISVYYLFAYHTVRTDFIQVFTLYSFAFLGFLCYYNSVINLKTLIFIGIAFRLIFIGAIPNLSDDFYRFLWDGRAIFKGINPYLILPENNPSLINEGVRLYKGMGSMNGSHYTCYPPLNQFAFVIPSLVSDSNLWISTLVMRLSLILSDLVTLFYGVKLLRYFGLPSKRILIYFMNPFIIIELIGNLHYEGVMIAFLTMSLYFLLKHKNNTSALLLGCSVSIKLIPLIFIPLLFKRLGFVKTIIYGVIVALVNVILFIPFMSVDLYQNFMSSIELYFQNFEFNASIYYIIREIGYHVKGYNIIQTVGKVTPIVVIVFVFILSFLRQNNQKSILLTSMLWVVCFYYFLSSIVHPWYIAIPLFLSLFTKFRFPVLWSYVVILSYSAYITSSYQENIWLVGLEYFLVFGFILYEFLYNDKEVFLGKKKGIG